MAAAECRCSPRRSVIWIQRCSCCLCQPGMLKSRTSIGHFLLFAVVGFAGELADPTGRKTLSPVLALVPIVKLRIGLDLVEALLKQKTTDSWQQALDILNTSAYSTKDIKVRQWRHCSMHQALCRRASCCRFHMCCDRFKAERMYSRGQAAAAGVFAPCIFRACAISSLVSTK